MISQEQFVQSLVREIEIIKHLYTKIDPAKLDYRPTPGQRSTLELLQYLGRSITTAVKGNMAGDQNVYMELAKAPNPVTFENFPAMMDEQAKFVKETIPLLTDEQLEKESTVFGSTNTLAMHLLGVLKSAVAYKMQLFLYIKASGNPHIGTSNLWAGMDARASA